MAICQINLDAFTLIKYVERSKSRNSVEQILESDLKTIFPADVVTQLETYRDEIATRQYQIQNGKAENPKVLAQHLQQLRQQRNELQNRYLPVGYGFKFDSFQATLDEDTAIIEWYFTSTALETFIITRKNLQRLTISLLSDNVEALTNWNNDYLQAYYNNKPEWTQTLDSRLSRLTEILQIESILRLIPIKCSRLALIPHRSLHLFPLHALPLVNGEFLCEKFSKGISYAPSCQVLQQLQIRSRPNFKSIFAIQNPTQDLDYSDLEVDSILNLFSTHQVLRHEYATKASLLQEMPQLREANCLHFSCHGLFNLSSPQDSCLVLAESIDETNILDLSKCLTLGNLYEINFALNQCRLVVLSSCETGLVDYTNLSDEYLGFASAFLVVGSTSVVASLWSVDDMSTALLMIKFYQNMHAGNTVAAALNQAQMWLRYITVTELKKWIEDNISINARSKLQINRQLNQYKTEQPFGNPFHWAAFCYIGKLESQEMSPYQENILTFVYVLRNKPELLTVENRTEILELLATLPDDVEEISNAIALWYQTRPQILDAILNVPIEGLDSLRAADGRSTPITGAESKEMIENSVTESSKSNQSDSSSSQTKKESN